jgi:aspartate/methionine/tyrosine aminotransferase
MAIAPFKLERYFASYEFSAPYLLSCSDCEALSLSELLALGDESSLNLWHNLKLGYTESQGHPVLREEIARLYSNIQPADVLVVTPEEGIYIAMSSLLKSGDHVVTTFPGYQSLYEVALSIGCEVTKWEPTFESGWVFDVKTLKGLIIDRTKLIVINFPHNPTGATVSESELREIVEFAQSRNIILFSDEMYRFLEYDSSTRIPSACELYDNAISLFGMSKSFALAGLRIGWLTTKNSKLLNQIAIYKDYTTICSSAPSEVLAIIGLRAKDKIIARNLSIISQNIDLLEKFFCQYPDLFEWHRPTAGPIAFPKLKINVDITKFCLDLVNRKGVMLLPSSVYDYSGNFFRVGFARRNMHEALDQLNEYVEEGRLREGSYKHANKNL